MEGIPMKKRTPLLVASIAALLVAGSALAMPHEGGRHGNAMFGAKFDTNGDGQIEIAEIEAATLKQATEVDANRDGIIEAAELKAWHAAQRAKREQARLLRLDADGDGRVSVEEYAAGRAERLARRDANQDGVISRDELRPHRHGKRQRAAPAAD